MGWLPAPDTARCTTHHGMEPRIDKTIRTAAMLASQQLKLALPAQGLRAARDSRAAACWQARGARLRIHTVPHGKRQLNAASAAAHNHDLLPKKIKTLTWH